MATIKSFTSLKQSKVLAKILPLESADMVIWGKDLDAIGATDAQKLMKGLKDRKMNYIPCWSLQALLDEIPYTIMNKQQEDLSLHIEKDGLQYCLFYENEYNGDMFEIETDMYDNMIDACVEMIVKLNEQDLL